MPPSFDVFKANANSRRKSDKKRGGQKNHPVHRSDLNDKPDKIITLMVKKAPSGAVKKIDDKGQCYYAVQEIDASFRVCITETRFLIDEENSTEVDQSVMQKYRINPVSYSNHTKSMMLDLNGKGIIAFDRQCEMMNALSEGRLSIKPSTVVNWLDEFSARSEEVRKQILDNILTSHSGILIPTPKCKNIDLMYVKYMLEPIFQNANKGRQGDNGKNEYTTLNKAMIQSMHETIRIPIDNNGQYDLKVQKLMTKKYRQIDRIKAQVNNMSEELSELTIR